MPAMIATLPADARGRLKTYHERRLCEKEARLADVEAQLACCGERDRTRLASHASKLKNAILTLRATIADAG